MDLTQSDPTRILLPKRIKKKEENFPLGVELDPSSTKISVCGIEKSHWVGT